MFNLISVLILVAVTFLSTVDGQCTFQSPFSGSSWHDNTRGTLTFTSTSMSGWSFTAYGQTISTWECLDSSDSATLVLRSTNTIRYSTAVIYAYMCLRLTSITDYSYYYYQQQAQQVNAGSERLKFSSLSTLTSADVCDDTIAVPVAEYHVLVKSGSESLAKTTCPDELLFSADYTHTATDDTTSCETSQDVWDVCTDTTQMTFNYTTCSQEIAFSSGGKMWCVATVYSTTDPSYPHTVVYNQDATIGASGNQFACITSDGASASVAPDNCTATQTPSAFPTRADGSTTMGHTLAISTKYVTCVSSDSSTSSGSSSSSSSSSNTGLIIGMVFLVIIIVGILVTVLICCYIYKRKNRVEERRKPMIANGAIARVETIDETMAGVGRQTTITSIGLIEKSDASLALRDGAKPKDKKSKLFSFLVCCGKDKGLVVEPMSRHDKKAEKSKKAKAKSKAKPIKKGGKTKGKKGIKGKKNDPKKASTEALDVLPPMRREISNVKKSPISQKRSAVIQPEGGDAVPDGKSSLLPLMASTPEPHSATAITIEEPPTAASPTKYPESSKMMPRAATETDMKTPTDTSKLPSAPKRAVTNLDKGKKKSDGGKSPRTPKKSRKGVVKSSLETKKKSVTVSDVTPRQTYPDPNARMDVAKPNLNIGNEDHGKSSTDRERFPPIKSGRKIPTVSLSGIKSSMVQEKGNARDWTFLTCCFGNRSPPSQDGRKKNVTKGLTKKGKGKANIKGKSIDKKAAVSPKAGQETSGGNDTEGGKKGNYSENIKINGELLFNTIQIKTAMSRRAEASSPPNKTQLSLSRSNTLPIKSVEEKEKPKSDDKVKVDVYVPNDKTRLTLKDTVTVVNKTDKPRSKSVVGTMHASPTTKGSPGKKSPRKKDGKSPRRKKAKQGGKKKKSK